MPNNIQDIKDKIIEIQSKKKGKYTSVSYGYKVTNGVVTGELAIIYGVKKKLPASAVLPEDLVPESVDLPGGSVSTDVIQITKVEALACNIACGDQSQSGPNRQKVRPLQGGVSLCSDSNINAVGTMGFIAVDSATQAFVGVTNNHVNIADAFYTTYRTNVIANDTFPINKVYQDGEFSASPSTLIVGQSLRYVPIFEDDGTSSTINRVDAAMFSVNSTDIDINVSYKQIGESYNQPLPFATTAEIDNLLVSNPMLYSSGRTTGPKGGASCPMRVFAINAATIISYQKETSQAIAFFADCIQFVKPVDDPNIATICYEPISAGDSGSALIADFGGVRKIIGICFAGSDNGTGTTIGWACRIDNVAAELGIEAWTGGLKNFVDTASITYKTVPGINSTKQLNCNGEVYWQSGRTTLDNPC